MTFTYDDTSVSTNLDKVRFLIGDTDSSNAIFTDEELNLWSPYDLYTWAGYAMMSIASSSSRIATLIKAGGSDLTVDRKSVAEQCRKQAQAFFKRSEEEPYATEVRLEDGDVEYLDTLGDESYSHETEDDELNTP